jgi:hypothetical protein
MALDPQQLGKLQYAYKVLDLPQTASAQQIKQAYRKLTKRWHPDLYSARSPEQAEATLMMKIINEAYDQVATAPLRYYDPRKETTQTRERDPYVEQPRPIIIFQRDRSEPPQKLHLFEFSVRFFFGTLFGVFAAFRTIVRFYYVTPHTAAMIAIAEVLGCGLVAGFLGDQFWLEAFRRTLWWR